MSICLPRKSVILACGIALVWSTLARGAFAAVVATGIDLGGTYIQDLFSNFDGGRRRGTAAPGIIDLSAEVDGRAWGGSDNDQFFFDYLFFVRGSRYFRR